MTTKRRTRKVPEVPLRGKAASVKGGGATALGTRAVDPSDPSGNTIYVSTASGGVWKQTRDIPTRNIPLSG